MNQSVWSGFCRNWTWMGIPVMVIALAMLGWLIAGLVSLVRSAQLFRVPVAERQDVYFNEAGRVILNIEGPRFTTRFAHAKFELAGTNGERVEGQRVWMGVQTSSFSRVRMELLSYDIPKPGRYVLTITGMGDLRAAGANPASGYSPVGPEAVPGVKTPGSTASETNALNVVFTKPHLKQTVAYIVGILLASMAFLTSLVFFVLCLFERGQET